MEKKQSWDNGMEWSADECPALDSIPTPNENSSRQGERKSSPRNYDCGPSAVYVGFSISKLA
ncbi:hypothetical protein AVEN_237681-1, partial [Araneus ventricosus]